MPSQPPTFRNAHWSPLQCGPATGMQLVRVTGLCGGNVYTARPVEFDGDGQTQFASDREMRITNLAEPPGAAGSLPGGTDAIAVDVEGRWVTFVRQAAAAFAAKVMGASGGAAYVVRPQTMTPEGAFVDLPGAADVTALNLAELSAGPGGAVDDGSIVLVTGALESGSPPAAQYVFDRSPYAKYLD